MGILSTIKNGLAWVGNRGYKTVTGFLTILWMFGVLINPLLTTLFTGLWMIFVFGVTWSWNKAKGSTQWTVRTVIQQFKDWREGRRRRKELQRQNVYGS